MHRGIIGTQNINRVLQEKLNHEKKGVTRGETTFCVGDKVMQVQNNYDLGVFNGDIGYVTGMNDDHELTVAFNGELVRYALRDLDELVHAYCISIHKSQGCEFRAVVIPLVTQHFIMLQRNLVYTALTRAKELCVLVGSQKALGIAVRNNEALARYTRLGERLKGL
jgi:exodeoxyribonuclease V alpha subunit